MSYNADYAILLDLLFRLVQSQAGNRIEHGQERLNEAQILSNKLFRHLFSMQNIAAVATFEQNDIPIVSFIDHASVKVVARAALETYLVFFYLYGSADRKVSEFRHITWRLGGLTDRQTFHASTEVAREVLVKEKQQIEVLKSKLEKAPQFLTYSPKKRAELLKGNWRTGNSWSNLGVKSGFHERYFKNIYSYLCGYSHSSYLSALQIGQSKTIADQRRLTQSILSIGLAIMAQFTFNYSNIFDSANHVLESNPETKRIAEKWRLRPEEMAAIYNR